MGKRFHNPSMSAIKFGKVITLAEISQLVHNFQPIQFINPNISLIAHGIGSGQIVYEHLFLGLFLWDLWEAYGLTMSEGGTHTGMTSIFSSFPMKKWLRWGLSISLQLMYGTINVSKQIISSHTIELHWDVECWHQWKGAWSFTILTSLMWYKIN